MKTVRRVVLGGPHVVYVMLAVFFTIAFMVVMSPMSTPDAPDHFVRAYTISQGRFVARETGPGVKSVSFESPGATQGTVTGLAGFRPVRSGYYLPSNLVSYLYGERYATSGMAVDRNHPGRSFVYGSQAEGNSPVAYAPQVLALLVVRLFTNSPAVMAYAQEIMLAAVWILCIAFAIRVAPFGKWALLCVALLPMQIQDSFQLGADVMTTAPAVLLMALLARRIADPRSAAASSLRELAMLCALAALAMQGKIVMAPMLLLLLLYPLGFSYISYTKGSFFQGIWRRALFLIPPIVCSGIWSYTARRTGRSISDIYVTAAPQLAMLRGSPFGFIRTWMHQCVRWILGQFDFISIIGNFKMLEKPLPAGVALMAFLVLCMVLLASAPRDMAPAAMPPGAQGSLPPVDTSVLGRRQRVMVNGVFAIAALGVLAATLLAIYIIWNPTASYGILGVQGRYLLPCLYIVALMVPPKPIHVGDATMRRACVIMPALLFIASFVMLLR